MVPSGVDGVGVGGGREGALDVILPSWARGIGMVAGMVLAPGGDIVA